MTNWLGKWVALVALLAQISRERRALARLSDEQLQDIGLTRKSAVRESSRHVFEIPVNRLRRRCPGRMQRMRRATPHRPVADLDEQFRSRNNSTAQR